MLMMVIPSQEAIIVLCLFHLSCTFPHAVLSLLASEDVYVIQQADAHIQRRVYS